MVSVLMVVVWSFKCFGASFDTHPFGPSLEGYETTTRCVSKGGAEDFKRRGLCAKFI